MNDTIRDILSEEDRYDHYRVLETARDDHFGVLIKQLKKAKLYSEFKSVEMFWSCNEFILESDHFSMELKFNGDFLGIKPLYIRLKSMEDVKNMGEEVESLIKLKDDENFLSVFVTDEFIDSYYYLSFVEDIRVLYRKKNIL